VHRVSFELAASAATQASARHSPLRPGAEQVPLA